MTSSWCHQMCMNGKVNQGPLFDISVWCNRSLKTKLHPMIVRQYSHFKSRRVFSCIKISDLNQYFWFLKKITYKSKLFWLKNHLLVTCFKGPYADHIFIPRAQPEEVYFFLYQLKTHSFLIANPKFQLQILCRFGDITKSVKLNSIPENNFLCIFIIASSPGVHTFFCLRRVNKKLPQGETSQNAFQRSRSIN